MSEAVSRQDQYSLIRIGSGAEFSPRISSIPVAFGAGLPPTPAASLSCPLINCLSSLA
jgi:hypothetical protein